MDLMKIMDLMLLTPATGLIYSRQTLRKDPESVIVEQGVSPSW
jgi:hypothetical protein